MHRHATHVCMHIPHLHVRHARIRLPWHSYAISHMYMCMFVCVCRYIHICIFIYIYTYIHILKINSKIHILRSIQTYIHSYKQTYKHTSINSYIEQCCYCGCSRYLCILTYQHTYIYTYIHTYIYTYSGMFTYIHTNTQTFKNAYSHTDLETSTYLHGGEVVVRVLEVISTVVEV